MTRHMKKTTRTLGFQQLEDRALMTGNVSVVVKNGSLFVTGDNKTNTVEVSQTGNGQYTLVSFLGDDTKINGKTGPQTFSGVTGDINIDLKNGDDLISVDTGASGKPSVVIPHNLNINLNNGNHVAYFLDMAVGGNVSIKGGSGNNDLDFNNSKIGTLGTGDCLINLGSGNDDVFMSNTTVQRDLSIKMNSSHNKYDFLDLYGDTIGRNATIQTGSGDDSISLNGFKVGSKLQIQTNDGNDRVALGGFDNNFIGTSVPLAPVVADQVFLDLGKGDDYLKIGGNGNKLGGGVVANSAAYQGGKGVDAVFNYSNAPLTGTFSGFDA